ncbi:G-type lectin S-receptor-like serine/threonine-protein kinase SD2-2 [Mercurialis annua]|uniref:G-type lectin S-receptor-like serine/threonine-protein kinase SD2-2 n=1 Tax=Mercurialis annua TaxID=3986 RepID=UPI00215E8F36|nr:G-type lectin S-receptor-like serine/threonine-protein kinase SD2-2 [Mercurialis annua]
MSPTLCFLLIFLVAASNSSLLVKSEPLIAQDLRIISPNSSNFEYPVLEDYNGARKSEKPESKMVIITGNFTIPSENYTFQMGFFTPNGGSKWYLGIWYASTPTPTYVWVANRETPVTNLASSTLELTELGQLSLTESKNSVIWQSSNSEKATEFRFLDNGNLILLSATGSVLWQSFDYPTDTWLPGMNITKVQSLTSWRSLADPSPGLYSLRLSLKGFNEFELVFNKSVRYWSTGNWNGKLFTGVPEMTVPYIYNFHFADPFSPTASFWYTEVAASDAALKPPLTRFRVDVNGQLKQFTWASQVASWNMFWSQPENQCKVYGLCGELGFCSSDSESSKPCFCLSGFTASDYDWEYEDYSGGCVRESGDRCNESDGFVEAGMVAFEGGNSVSYRGSRSDCERFCLGNCSCVGLIHDQRSNLCKNLYGSLLNLRNLSSEVNYQDVLSIRVPKEGTIKKNDSKSVLLIGGILASIAICGLMVGILLILQMRRKKIKGICKGKGNSNGEDGGVPMLNLKVFSYKDLHAATKGFADKLGHGGFGAVFQGELLDSTRIAVKRLERPGGGEKEFRAEVCTIGNIQHVNLVRLIGFCSENSHRLLVYDYMSNGPISVYLRQDGPNLSWDVRFRIAVGTARGIAYLHEGCRDCIIHCDIKPENILLDGDYTAKVSDFGLAKLVGRDFSRVLATMRGTWGYVAPEWISGVAITTKADVYSYGMTLLELLSGRRNVEAPPSAGGGKKGEHGEKWFFPPYAAQQIIDGNVAAVVDYRLGRSYKTDEAERVGLVAIWCIQDSEDERPTMGMVVKMLEGVVEVAIPPAPKLLQALISGDSYHGIQIDSGTGIMPVSSDCSEGRYALNL